MPEYDVLGLDAYPPSKQRQGSRQHQFHHANHRQRALHDSPSRRDQLAESNIRYRQPETDGGSTAMRMAPIAIVAAAIAMSPAIAAAQSPATALSPWYFSFSGGVIAVEDADIGSVVPTVDAVLRQINAEITTDLGFSGSAALGYEFGEAFRIEGELGFRKVDLDKGNSSLGQVSVEGDAQVFSLMLNVAYDFRFKNSAYSAFVPYVGGGVGVAFHDAELSKVNGLATGLTDGDDTTFAYQGLIGISNEVPQQTLGFFVQYRYFATDDPDYGFLTSELRTHAVEVGIRANF